MLTFFSGLSNTGKTYEIFKLIGKTPSQSHLLIVPELYSHEYEREICEVLGNSVSGYCEVLSFTSLCDRIFAQTTGLCDKYLDLGARILIVREAILRCQTSLKFYSDAHNKSDLISQIADIVDEFRCFNVQDSEVLHVSSLTEGIIGDKLYDLGLIYGTYNSIAVNELSDPRDRLSRLCDNIPCCAYFDNSNVYFDGFSGFTSLEYDIIREIMKKSGDIVFSFTKNGNDVFKSIEKTMDKLKTIYGKPVSYRSFEGNKSPKTKTLIDIEQVFLGDIISPVFSSVPLEIYQADDIYDQIRRTAHKIRCAVDKDGLRYRDIAVCARNMDEYSDIVRMIFKQYDIPVFIAQKTDILSKPIVCVILSALNSIRYGYKYEDVFSCLKSGLWDLTWDEIYKLENYVISKDIRSDKWKNVWTQNISDYTNPHSKKQIKDLDYLNQARQKVSDSFMFLEGRIAGFRKCGEICQAVYDFLIFKNIPRKISEMVNEFYKNDDMQAADEYEALWSVIVNILEQIVWINRDVSMDIDVFVDIFKLMLYQYDIAVIPSSIDSVACGNIERVCFKNSRYVFLIGAEDGNIPQTKNNTTLLTQYERENLNSLGIELNDPVRIDNEMQLIYKCISCPLDRFFISCVSSADGLQKPSDLMTQLCDFFPNADIKNTKMCREENYLSAIKPAFELACMTSHELFTEKSSVAYDFFKNDDIFLKTLGQSHNHCSKICDKSIVNLFGSEISLTSSKIDSFNSCNFAFFMKYGLKPEIYRKNQLNSIYVGNFLHFIAQKIIKSIVDTGVENVDNITVSELFDEFTLQYISLFFNDFESESFRLKRVFQTIRQKAYDIILNLVDELKNSDFKPIEFEFIIDIDSFKSITLKSSTHLPLKFTFCGKVDRIDVFCCDNNLFLRVIDYKSGLKTFSLTDFYYGLNSQLLLYLSILTDHNSDHFFKKLHCNAFNILPAGALYIPMRDVIVAAQKTSSNEIIAFKTSEKLKRTGVLLDEKNILRAMDKSLTQESCFLPVKFNKDGNLSSLSCTYSQLEIKYMLDYSTNILNSAALEISSGNISPNPYYKSKDQNACMFCEFSKACQYEISSTHNHLRYLHPVKHCDFFKDIEKERKT